MDFVAIDVETANASMASICQIGVASYHDGKVIDEWKTYVNPECYFDPVNVSIHGIDEDTVAGAPLLPDTADTLCSKLEGQVAVCHTHFDRVALQQAFRRYNLENLNCTWLDSARVARRTWNEFASCGYGIRNLCDFLEYDFKHHDALEDAKAAGHILLAAMKETGLSIDGWLERVEQPITRCDIPREGNPNGPLYGEVIVFTGWLELPRSEAADLAAKLGCEVAGGVTRNTTILVVGDQDVERLAGHSKSIKHRKAEALIAGGQEIRILRESDFMEMVEIVEMAG